MAAVFWIIQNTASMMVELDVVDIFCAYVRRSQVRPNLCDRPLHPLTHYMSPTCFGSSEACSTVCWVLWIIHSTSCPTCVYLLAWRFLRLGSYSTLMFWIDHIKLLSFTGPLLQQLIQARLYYYFTLNNHILYEPFLTQRLIFSWLIFFSLHSSGRPEYRAGISSILRLPFGQTSDR